MKVLLNQKVWKVKYLDNNRLFCIEIHHLKPIFQYSNTDITQAIEEAIKNLLPVCPNCHRAIHKNGITAERIPDFKREIASIHS